MNEVLNLFARSSVIWSDRTANCVHETQALKDLQRCQSGGSANCYVKSKRAPFLRLSLQLEN